MRSKRLAVWVFFVFVLVVWNDWTHTLASPPPQNKRSKADADLNAIGHRSIAHDTNFYSPAKEKELGKSLSQEVERTSKLLNDQVITDFVGRIAQNVAHNSDARLPITLRVIDSDNVDAFTLAGGYQYVSRGLLLRLEGEAELASVLARGIAHTALRSATREATKEETMQLAVIPLNLSGTGGLTPNEANVAIPLTVLKMKRDGELDADYFGVQYLYKAGYDPRGFIDFVQRIWGTTPLGSETRPKTSSGFPPLAERLAAIRKEISEILPPRASAKLSTPEFDEFKERLRGQVAHP
jgi:beta-barrel assembly-enhancing protease